MITYLFQLQGLVFLSIYHPGNQRLVRKAYNKLQKLSAEDLTIYPKKNGGGYILEKYSDQFRIINFICLLDFWVLVKFVYRLIYIK